jgi:hypothetical protein
MFSRLLRKKYSFGNTWSSVTNILDFCSTDVEGKFVSRKATKFVVVAIAVMGSYTTTISNP